jgi:hypothetical protein
MRQFTPLAFLLLCLSLNTLASNVVNVTQRCPSHDRGSGQLRIIDPPPFSAITLPVTITVCVPQHLLRWESLHSMNVSLQLTINTLVVTETRILPEVTFSIGQNVSEDLHVGMVAYPSLEFCVYLVAVDSTSRHLFGRAYSCILTSASGQSLFYLEVANFFLPAHSTSGSSRDSVVQEQSRLMYLYEPLRLLIEFQCSRLSRQSEDFVRDWLQVNS